MKIINLVLLFVTFLISSNGWAVEPINDQQAIFYYQVPFGGAKVSDKQHTFGFRVDRVTLERSGAQYQNSTNLNDLMKKPASLDLQIGRSGIASFKMHGYDYLPYILSQAAGEGEDESGGTEVDAESGNDGEVTESGEEKEKLVKFSDVVNQTSFGIMLGVGIGIIALTGSGG